MSKTAVDTLFYPLESGSVDIIGKILFVGAIFHPLLPSFSNFDAYQPFKPLADTLLSFPTKLLLDIPDSQIFDACFVNVPKQADEARYWLAASLQNLKTGGFLFAAADNDAGGGRIKGWMEDLGLGDIQSFSKHKARVVWGIKSENTNPDVVKKWKLFGEVSIQNLGNGLMFHTCPGVFSWDRIDLGSSFLSEYMPKNIKGVGADFGCGLGYLSQTLLTNNNNLKSLHLIDADARAVDCAKMNMEKVNKQTDIFYYWHDLSKRLETLPALDFVIMNPPFHQGRKQDISLGKSFIVNAAHHLRKGGMLYMVANAHLPYEDILKQCFSQVKMVVQKNGFKIIEAQK
jgi:16S rRNA (guanine1207-N2)-methyltransferase